MLALQLPGQPLDVQSSGAQFVEPGTEQPPLPLQKAAGVKVLPEQVADWHIVLVGACWQALQAATLQQAPSTQFPLPHSWSAPQVPPSPLSAVHVPPAVQ